MYNLHNSYKELFTASQRIGRDTFRDVVRFLTKRGESKSGVSTYYIQFRYASSVFVKMINRIKDFHFKTQVSRVGRLAMSKELLDLWEKIEQFLKWEYSSLHMLIKDSNNVHCCFHAFGSCLHKHDKCECPKCSLIFHFY